VKVVVRAVSDSSGHGRRLDDALHCGHSPGTGRSYEIPLEERNGNSVKTADHPSKRDHGTEEQ